MSKDDQPKCCGLGAVADGACLTPELYCVHRTPKHSVHITEEDLVQALAKPQPANPKQIYGDQNVPLHLFPASAIAGGAMAFLEGNLKYGRLNFRAAPVEAMTYARACNSHMKKWEEGQDIDPDSNLDELFKALACIAILIDAKYAGTLIDNRNFKGGHFVKMLEDLKTNVAEMREKHKDKNPRHYTIADNEA